MKTPTRLDRAPLLAWYERNRKFSAMLFASIAEDAFYDRPIPLRHPPIFYEGHIPAFSYNTLVRKALAAPSLNAQYETLFERGIDPTSVSAAGAHARSDWPTRAQVQAYGRAVDTAVLDALANAPIDDGDGSPLLAGAQAAYTILEHEEMHHETLLYLIARLPPEHKRPPGGSQEHHNLRFVRRARVEIPYGEVTLGASDAQPFGWDNEYDGATFEVPRFAIDADPVTNGEYRNFVDDGGPVPSFWIERDGEYLLRTTYGGEIPLPASWPVYATQEQAVAYARWADARLPTEAEYHRAAFGTPDGEERPYPWGDEAPGPQHGNFDYRRYDPEPVGSTPAGASAWGVRELVGNGWEWTSTPFGPLPGFAPMASYPRYSADFFDDRHYVVKGASPVTSRNLIRRSFRNWFYADYPYMFAKFRTVTS